MNLNSEFVIGCIMLFCGIGLLTISLTFVPDASVSENVASFIEFQWMPGVVTIFFALIKIIHSQLIDSNESAER
jgi:hypothetical protein